MENVEAMDHSHASAEDSDSSETEVRLTRREWLQKDREEKKHRLFRQRRNFAKNQNRSKAGKFERMTDSEKVTKRLGFRRKCRACSKTFVDTCALRRHLQGSF